VISDDGNGAVFVEFLRSMLRLKPSDRATAGELLGRKWLSKRFGTDTLHSTLIQLM